jgi:hypothetical protein
VEEQLLYKTQVITDAQGQASPHRLSQRFVTLLKAIVGLLWLKFFHELGTCISYRSVRFIIKNELLFKKCLPELYPGFSISDVLLF